MKCDRILDLLSDYIDGELSAAAVLGVQSHLRRCAACEHEHQALRRTLQLVALFGRQQVPIDCRDAVMAQLREAPAAHRRVAWPVLRELWMLRAPVVPSWARATALAGLAAVSIGAGTLMFNHSEAPRSPIPTTRLAFHHDDGARMRESYQLLQALGRDDGYILAADVVDENP